MRSVCQLVEFVMIASLPGNAIDSGLGSHRANTVHLLNQEEKTGENQGHCHL